MVTRRGFFKTAMWGSSAAVALPSSGQHFAGLGATVRDRLWVFTAPVNSDYLHLGRRSVMTPVEFAYFMGTPNMIVVQASPREAQYGRFEPPYEQYTVAMRPLKRVVWSMVGSGGQTSAEEREQILELARHIPNFVGLMFDDFFSTKAEQGALLRLSELRAVHERAKSGAKPLDLFVTLYVSPLDLPIDPYLELMDVITLWTWKPAELANLSANFDKLEYRWPNKRKLLGCYLVDYPGRESLSIEVMKKQCELGLRWLQERRIEGMIFLGNTVGDLGFEAVDWTRDWVSGVAERRID